MRVTLLPLLLLSGCCSCSADPTLTGLADLTLEESTIQVDLTPYLDGGSGTLVWSATSSDVNVIIASADEGLLDLTAQPDAFGTVEVTVSVTDACDRVATATFAVTVGVVPPTTGVFGDDREFFADPCAVTLTYTEQLSPDAVYVAGDFNDWSPSSHPMVDQGGGVWSLTLPRDELPEGPFAYKFVESVAGSPHWTCDPAARMMQCEQDYKDPAAFAYTHTCQVDVAACNSMLVLEDPDVPRLWVDAFTVDRAAGGFQAQVRFTAGCAGDARQSWTATLDGAPLTTSDADSLALSATGLPEGRHTVRVTATDAAGRVTEETYLPFWVEPVDGWRSGVLYFAFIDRFARGSWGDEKEGASADLADYEGGDLDGLTRSLDYLQDLGITAIWLSNVQDNAEGVYSGDCGTYSSFHGYWPTDPTDVEGHIGDDDALHTLVDEAHARGIRVLLDWAANHVHEDHPYYATHPDWFASYDEQMLCDLNGNWDANPETCWFDPFLPDIWYYNPEPLHRMVEDALWWVREYEFDGFRVDAAKHMSHSVVWNLNARLDQEVEHAYAGGDEDFYTVGETFSGADVVKQYVNEHELDGQFDFDLYWAARASLLTGSPFSGMESTLANSASVYGDALMGTFLGNHDVSRFISYGVTGGASDGWFCSRAGIPGSEGDWSFSRLELGWTFLLTVPGLPLVYYGDELGLPGYHDPDNRHPLWWYAWAFDGVDHLDLDAVLDGGFSDGRMEDVLRLVSTLAPLRREHPAMWSGTTTQWWLEDQVLAYSRVADGDALLVILNGDSSDRTFSNGLSFAGLPTDGIYEDLLTGDRFTASGDSISVGVGAGQSRVLLAP